jgi:hypothetical protein
VTATARFGLDPAPPELRLTQELLNTTGTRSGHDDLLDSAHLAREWFAAIHPDRLRLGMVDVLDLLELRAVLRRLVRGESAELVGSVTIRVDAEQAVVVPEIGETNPSHTATPDAEESDGSQVAARDVGATSSSHAAVSDAAVTAGPRVAVPHAGATGGSRTAVSDVAVTGGPRVAVPHAGATGGSHAAVSDAAGSGESHVVSPVAGMLGGAQAAVRDAAESGGSHIVRPDALESGGSRTLTPEALESGGVHAAVSSGAARNEWGMRWVREAGRSNGEGAAWLRSAILAECLLSRALGSWPRLKLCRNYGCPVAFYDRSRNGSRIWHDVSTCGNAANVRAHRDRNRTFG